MCGEELGHSEIANEVKDLGLLLLLSLAVESNFQLVYLRRCHCSHRRSGCSLVENKRSRSARPERDDTDEQMILGSPGDLDELVVLTDGRVHGAGGVVIVDADHFNCLSADPIRMASFRTRMTNLYCALGCARGSGPSIWRGKREAIASKLYISKQSSGRSSALSWMTRRSIPTA